MISHLLPRLSKEERRLQDEEKKKEKERKKLEKEREKEKKRKDEIHMKNQAKGIKSFKVSAYDIETALSYFQKVFWLVANLIVL